VHPEQAYPAELLRREELPKLAANSPVEPAVAELSRACVFVLGGASVTTARRIRSLPCIRCPRRFLCASGCNQCCSEDVSNETGVS